METTEQPPKPAGRRLLASRLFLAGLLCTVLGCVGSPALFVFAVIDALPSARTALPGTVTVQASPTQPLRIWYGQPSQQPSSGITAGPMQTAPSPTDVALSITNSAGATVQYTPWTKGFTPSLTEANIVYQPIATVAVTSPTTLAVSATPPPSVPAGAPNHALAVGADETPLGLFISAAAAAVLAMGGVVLVIIALIRRV
jgi:hypothetical protein